MCGVVGYSGSNGDRELFISLCRQSTIRGIHAFGVAWLDQQMQLHSYKSTSFYDTINIIPKLLPNKIIFHNRYCTSGDFRIAENNQPLLSLDRESALVFNGTIDMGNKFEMEQRSGYALRSENDGELVLQDILNGNPVKRINSKGVSFAGLFLRQGGRMFALRNNNRPLWCFEHYNGKYLCSTKDIAFRAKLATYGFPVKPLEIFDL